MFGSLSNIIGNQGVQQYSINCMDVINEYVAISCGNGVVQFYHYSLRIVAWFEDIFALFNLFTYCSREIVLFYQ